MSDFTEEERSIIDNEFPKLMETCVKCRKNKQSEDLIWKAFNLARDAHDGYRRKSGEPYIFHPIAVAKIVAGEIGLGATAVTCALLHDVVEDTEFTLEDIENIFNPKIASIIDGLTKIGGVLKTKHSQAENLRKMLLTLSEDIRVILIKLADRLHNMRTLGAMKPEKQLKISAETRMIFAPLAHRLGLYAIKVELEDLCLKYEHNNIYNEISQKLADTEEKRQHYLNRFCIPIMIKMENEGIDYHITGRPKSIASIWNKIRIKNISFEDIYDLFAVRIILNTNNIDEEKNLCWKVYSLVTDLYTPNPDRLRDWISTPKDNGYIALHTTVMGPEGRWVEVQIRTSRMDEIAERGYAAHFKYKNTGYEENQIDQWMKRLKTTLENPDQDALEFLDEFKLNLYASEIFVFTPTGDLKRMPTGSTVLDFAYEIHSDIGNHAVGAKINRHKTVPIDHIIESGDQVQIITSDQQMPQKHWLDIVITAKAKNNLKNLLRLEKRKSIKKGQTIFESKLKDLEIPIEPKSYLKILKGYGLHNKNDLYYKAYNGQIDYEKVKDLVNRKRQNKIIRYWKLQLNRTKVASNITKNRISEVEDNLILLKYGDNYKIAECCQPIPGDKIIGILDQNTIYVHKNNCEVAILSQKTKKAVQIKLVKQSAQYFLAQIKITGSDRIGLLNDITKIISSQLNINIRTVHVETSEKNVTGYLDLYIRDNAHLNDLMFNIQKVKGIRTVHRVDKPEDIHHFY